MGYAYGTRSYSSLINSLESAISIVYRHKTKYVILSEENLLVLYSFEVNYILNRMH